MTETDFIVLRRALHQIPELGFEEYQTQALLLEQIEQLDQTFLEVVRWRTGILVKVTGTNPTKMIGYRTDIDALPIKEETGLDFASKTAGKMHACGHDFHMSIAIGILAHFSKHQPKQNLVFIFQPAEEGPGGAKPMLESAKFKAFWPDEIYALHIAPEYKVGEIAIKPGLLFANTSELFIHFKGKGGHAAYPHLANDMVIAASNFVAQLQTIISRNIDPMDSALITIGKIQAGSAQNAIAEEALLEGTIRSADPETMQLIWGRLKKMAKGFAEAYECEIEFLPGSSYYEVFNWKEETTAFIHFLETEFPGSYVPAKAAMTGEDFGYFLAEIKGAMCWLGVDSNYGLHHAKLTPNEAAIPFAIEVFTKFLASR